jgi:DNA-directed RNA polymerase subunit D
MNIKKIGEKGSVTRLLINGTDVTMVNSLRRALTNLIPVLAIENVSIYENTSIMFDELLAHRLGLIPLKMDSKSYKLGDKVKLVLEKEGPATVYSKDIKAIDPKIEVINKKIPVVKLAKTQKLKLEMEAVVGTGKEHVKWQAGIAAYHELPEVNVSKKFSPDKSFLNECEGIFKISGKSISLDDPATTNLDLLTKCRDLAPKGMIEISFDDSSFVFMFDNYGNLKTSEAFEQAVALLEDKLKEFNEKIAKI